MEDANRSMEVVQKVDPVRRMAIYALHDPDGVLDAYRSHCLRSLRSVADGIVAVVNGQLTCESHEMLESIVDLVIIRENGKGEMEAWYEGMAKVGWEALGAYQELMLLDDSFFGPVFPLQEMIHAMETSDTDLYGTMWAGREWGGVVCGGIVIRQKLLHANAFRRYWQRIPKVISEKRMVDLTDFCRYVTRKGFRIGAYQGKRLISYVPEPHIQCVRRLIAEERIPFTDIRPFCENELDRMLSVGYGREPRDSLDYLQKHTTYQVNWIWDYILRTKNPSNIWQQMQLEYVVSKNSFEGEHRFDRPVAVIIHIYYKDLVEQIADYCLSFSEKTKFFITTIYEDVLQCIEDAFSRRKLNYICKIKPNIGVAMSTLWITYAGVVTSGAYDYICYFHDKKSPYNEYWAHGEQFFRRCCQNLFGTREVVENILWLFESNPRMGMVGAPLVYHGEYYATAHRSWESNYENTVKLADRLNIHAHLDPKIMPVAPYGDMFWFRADALKKAIRQGLEFEDFNVPYQCDGTIMHALERLYSFIVQDAGYYYADVINSDEARSDLVNYQSMLYSISQTLMKNGQTPTDYVQTRSVIDCYTMSGEGDDSALRSVERAVLKGAIRRRMPENVWKAFRGILTLLRKH